MRKVLPSWPWFDHVEECLCHVKKFSCNSFAHAPVKTSFPPAENGNETPGHFLFNK